MIDPNFDNLGEEEYVCIYGFKYDVPETYRIAYELGTTSEQALAKEHNLDCVCGLSNEDGRCVLLLGVAVTRVPEFSNIEYIPDKETFYRGIAKLDALLSVAGIEGDPAIEDFMGYAFETN